MAKLLAWILYSGFSAFPAGYGLGVDGHILHSQMLLKDINSWPPIPTINQSGYSSTGKMLGLSSLTANSTRDPVDATFMTATRAHKMSELQRL
jgi:hypothetical protein